MKILPYLRADALAEDFPGQIVQAEAELGLAGLQIAGFIEKFEGILGVARGRGWVAGAP
jgi:hypothetical protein